MKTEDHYTATLVVTKVTKTIRTTKEFNNETRQNDELHTVVARDTDEVEKFVVKADTMAQLAARIETRAGLLATEYGPA